MIAILTPQKQAEKWKIGSRIKLNDDDTKKRTIVTKRLCHNSLWVKDGWVNVIMMLVED